MRKKDWTPEQWQKWHKLVQWSHDAAHDAVKKMLSDAGIAVESLTFLQYANIEDNMAYAIRRGAMRMLNELNEIKEVEGVW